MIRFSIITCTFRAEKVIERTLNSVLHQHYDDVEHIIIDGASDDKTVALAKEYEEKSNRYAPEHRVRIISEPDRGLYDAMNKGLSLANGDYLVFLNAGDKLHSEDTLEQIASCVGDGETLPAVLYGDTNIVDDNGIFLHQRRLRPPKKLSWKSFRQGMLVCHQAFYARTDIAKTVYYDLSLRYSADVDWCIRVMKCGNNMRLPLRNIDAVLVDYLEGGLSIQNHQASLRERFAVMKRHYGLLTTLFMHAWFVVRAVFK